MNKSILHLCIILIICVQWLFSVRVLGATYGSMSARGIRVIFPPGMEGAAKEVISLYPGVRGEVEGFFGWSLVGTPTVLINRGQMKSFVETSADLVVGYAVPERSLIVIFYSRTSTSPSNLRVVLKHELCHIMLHQYVSGVAVPRWLDEGIAQVVSGTAGEVSVGREADVLRLARATRGLISLRSLSESFPSSPEGVLLAYAESRDFVRYLIDEFGRGKILSILQAMRRGTPAQEAIYKITGWRVQDLEIRWSRALKKRDTWFARLSYYLYEILFGLGALVCVYAFVRKIRARRAYRDEEEEGW